MRILIVSPSVTPIGTGKYGGIEKLVYDWSKALATKTNHSITVAAPYGSKVPNGVNLIETVKLPEQQDMDDLVESCLSRDFDVVHDYTHHHIFKNSNRAIHMTHDPILTKFDFKSKKNVLCYSNWQKQRFEAMYNQKALVMPCNFVDTDVFKPNNNHNRNNRFLFLAKLTPNKGAHLALQYCRELGYPIDIVGGLIPSDSRDYAHEVEVEVSHVRDASFHFNVTEEEKLRFLQNAKALIYPQSLDDSHWLTGIEAWVTGCPTICYNHGAMIEVNPNPFSVCENETEFKNRMYKVDSSDPDWVRRIATAKYSVDSILPKWLSLYEDVASGDKSW